MCKSVELATEGKDGRLLTPRAADISNHVTCCVHPDVHPMCTRAACVFVCEVVKLSVATRHQINILMLSASLVLTRICVCFMAPTAWGGPVCNVCDSV